TIQAYQDAKKEMEKKARAIRYTGTGREVAKKKQERHDHAVAARQAGMQGYATLTYAYQQARQQEQYLQDQTRYYLMMPPSRPAIDQQAPPQSAPTPAIGGAQSSSQSLPAAPSTPAIEPTPMVQSTPTVVADMNALANQTYTGGVTPRADLSQALRPFMGMQRSQAASSPYLPYQNVPSTMFASANAPEGVEELRGRGIGRVPGSDQTETLSFTVRGSGSEGALGARVSMPVNQPSGSGVSYIAPDAHASSDAPPSRDLAVLNRVLSSPRGVGLEFL
ncbi:hypothetical protein, partial [Herbaspirillum sp. RV1423]|uniref:hypothetical protein n=1 Tax=Herbaspirillum sp. RV1423 TaxID=1443993 RepID=UPI000554D48B